MPESPAWLAYQDRHSEALEVVALMYTDGDTSSPLALTAYQEMVDTLKFEKDADMQMTYAAILKSPSGRKRFLLVTSVAVISMLSGNNIISYYLGTMLDQAGITNTTTQLEIVRIILLYFLSSRLC